MRAEVGTIMVVEAMEAVMAVAVTAELEVEDISAEHPADGGGEGSCALYHTASAVHSALPRLLALQR